MFMNSHSLQEVHPTASYEIFFGGERNSKRYGDGLSVLKEVSVLIEGGLMPRIRAHLFYDSPNGHIGQTREEILDFEVLRRIVEGKETHRSIEFLVKNIQDEVKC